MYIVLYFNYYNSSLTLFKFYFRSLIYIIQGKLMDVDARPRKQRTIAGPSFDHPPW